ncbi:S-layer homology domain-containing protein [Lysinibacillus sp. NPDC096418]|uniref:S-layer homology domain-containing protein n=1 Tax=Lysinibacillus sp. NPDC096418 TaxID=3364138 RepID=UPI00381A0F2C
MKKIVTAFTATAVVASAVVPAPTLAAPSFTDVKTTDYYAEAITSLAERGIIKGYSDNTYRPGNSVTRGQAAKIIAGALGLDTKNVTNANFKDISTSDEFYGSITALANEGIINGFSDRTFRPWEPITRNQMAKIIAGAFTLETLDNTTPFTDLNKEYAGDIAALYTNDITTGRTATTFDGSSRVTRGQLAAFVHRAENIPAQDEEQQEEQQKEQQVNGDISAITGDKLTIGENTYTIPANLQPLFNESNKVALAKAKIEATVVGDALVEVNALTITAEGTQDNPVVLVGHRSSSPVASLATVAVVPFELTSKLTVASSYFEIKNINVGELVVTPKVKSLKLSQTIGKLSIEKDATVDIFGDATVKLAEIATEKPITIDLKGIIEKLNFTVSKAAIKFGMNTKISNVVTNGTDVSKLISNYSLVRMNISSVNGAIPPSVGSNESTSNGGSNGSSSNGGSNGSGGSVTQQISGKITAVTANSVTINNIVYKVDQQVAGLFTVANMSVLQNADIKVTVVDNKVMKVTALTVNNAGTLNGGNSTINGKLTVNIDGLNIKELTVTGDVHLTIAVTSAIDFVKVVIQGKLTTEEVPAIADSRNFRVASTEPILASEKPVTRLKITFADSTVAFVEIKKVDTTLSIYGGTQISVVALQANGSIYADPDVILPNLKIEDGVTKIELNASIASVEIESNDDIEITGKGNFDKVLVKTDKSVTLATTGTIKQLGSDTGNITLGKDVKVGATTSLSGEKKPAEELISNIEDVKDNVNVDINDNDLEDYVAAKVLPVEGRFGYATLSVLNAEGATIKYRLVKARTNNDIVAVGQKAPDNAIVYNKGDQFIPWFTSDIQVYKVDENDTILDAYEIQNWGTSNIGLSKMTVENNTIIHKTIFGQLPVTSEFMYFINGTQFFMPENLSSYTWKVDADGIPTLEIPLPKDFTYNADEFSRIQHHLYVKDNEQQGASGLYANDILGDYKKKDVAHFEALYQLAQLSSTGNDEFKRSLKHAIETLLSFYAYELEPVYDLSGKFLYNQHKSLVSKIDSVIDSYLAELKEKRYTTADEVKAMVLEVNEQNHSLIEQINIATEAVFALFVEDFNNYTGPDRLASTTTLEAIEKARALVNNLPESYRDKSHLTYLVNNAKELYAQLNGRSSVTVQSVGFGGIVKLNNIISVNTNKIVFENDATQIFIDEEQISFESIEQLATVLSEEGYSVTTNDTVFIATLADTVSPKEILLKNINEVISTTTDGVIEIEIAKLKQATQIEIGGQTQSFATVDTFIEELKKLYTSAVVEELDGRITFSSPTLTQADVFDPSLAEYTENGSVQEITITFTDVIKESGNLQLTFGGTVASSEYAESSAAIKDVNTLKIYVRTKQSEMPTSVTVTGLVDANGKVILVDDVSIK